LRIADHRTACPHARSVTRPASRVHAALTVLAFLLSSLAGVVHEATTRHVACAEHGEQIDSDVSAPVTDAASVVTDATRTDRVVRGQPATTLHGHEHCLMVSATRASRIAPCTPALAATIVASTELPGATAAYAVVRHDSVYRTAPKTSPPA